MTISIEKLSLKEKIGYGFGDAASSMFWKLIFGMYLVVFLYRHVLGISAAAGGNHVPWWLVCGIPAFDPYSLESSADRTKSRYGENTGLTCCG